jgi:hypothetical protein
MEEEKRDQSNSDKQKKAILKEDDGKRTPPTAPSGYVTGGDNPSVRPEQGPDIPPHERTEGIP